MNDHESNPCSCCHTFNVINFGITCGLTCGSYIFLIFIVAWQFHYGTGLVDLMSEWYVGTDLSLNGAFIAFFWTLIDAFIGGVIFAAIYNFLQHCRRSE